MIELAGETIASELLRHLQAAQARMDGVNELKTSSARLSMVIHEVEEWLADCIIVSSD